MPLMKTARPFGVHPQNAGFRATGDGRSSRLEGGAVSSGLVLTMPVSIVRSDHLRDGCARYHLRLSFG